MPEAPDPRTLLAHAGWLRGLAVQLVGDAHRAEDLVQDTWLSALRRPPRLTDAGEAGLRGWLARVLRRHAGHARGSEAARRGREADAARGERTPSTLDALERVATHRALVEMVLALDEPYRTAVVLRHFDGLSEADIARRTGATPATVHSRLQRGVARLRERLDRRAGGDRRAWLASVAALAAPPPGAETALPPAVPLALGAAVVNTSAKLVLGAAAAAVAVALWAVVGDLRATPRAVAPEGPRDEPALVADAPDRASTPPSDAPRAVVDAPAERGAPEPIAAPAPAPERTELVRGVVLDAHGAPLAGVELAAEPASALREGAVSGPDGRFAVRLAPGARQIVSGDPRWVTVLAVSPQVSADTETALVVAPRIAAAGRVRDEHGAPLADAELAVLLPDGWTARFQRVLDHSLRPEWERASAADGTFRFDALPGVEGLRLQAARDGYGPWDAPLPARGDEALDVVLPRLEPDGLEGLVVDPAGVPVEGALVSAGDVSTTSDAGGRFVFDKQALLGAERLLAVRRGFLPASWTVPGAPGRLARELPDGVVLELGPPPLAIEGRVLDGEDEPVPGARVWLDDATLFGLVGGNPRHVESLLGRESGPRWPFVLADGEGRFRIEGLLPREYRLAALDERSLVQARSEPVEAGRDDVVVRLAWRGEVVRVAGRVVTRAGEPVEGARVRAVADAYSLSHPGWGRFDDGVWSEEVRTDADGAFELEGLSSRVSMVLVAGDDIWNHGLRGEELGEDLAELEIVVERRLHLQVELEAPRDRADGVAVLDAAGQTLPIRVMVGTGHSQSSVQDVIDGRTEVLAVPESAAEIVLLQGDAEVERHAVHLASTGVNRLRF